MSKKPKTQVIRGEMSKQFSADLTKLHEMLLYIDRGILEAGFIDSDKYLIGLAVEEAIVNIINYAYESKIGEIEIDYKIDGNAFSVSILDSGLPFNPLDSGKNQEQNSSVNKHLTGGYGISFILKNIDEIQYNYENNKNILTLKKYITK